MAPNVKVFALSTCIHCKQAKQFLDDKNVVYECIHVDLLTGDDRKQAIEAVKKV
ncbi:glutaredoxin domain-containing protein, partial [Desulfolutivibrio sp.]|uniref:glutaredoxin domain-containing protein n=1 Tax=Desulfolutivibrio sp. TaxID=2773296 RepID=UPI002F963A0F